jgi:hypothetical protein
MLSLPIEKKQKLMKTLIFPDNMLEAYSETSKQDFIYDTVDSADIANTPQVVGLLSNPIFTKL